MSDSLQPHGLQHTRPPYPSPTPGVYSNLCPLTQWCHPAISSSVIPFSSCLQSFPASGSFPMSQFFASGGQIIGVVKILNSIRQQIQETQPWPQDWKRSVFIPIPKKGNAKECSNYCTIALISHASEVMLKVLQARLQQYVNMNFLMFKLVLETAEEPEIKLPTSAGSWKKQESSRKTSISALLTAKAFDCVDHN